MKAHLQFVSVRSANLFDVGMNIPFQKMRRTISAYCGVSLDQPSELIRSAQCRQIKIIYFARRTMRRLHNECEETS